MFRIFADIQAVMTNSSLPESFYESVLERLMSLGYAVKETDGVELGFAIQKTENHIKNSCNITSVPEGLLSAAVDVVCGEFLYTKKQIGRLELNDLDLTGAVTSIKEGDTSVNFASGTSEDEKLTSFLNMLMHSMDGDLVCYRKIQW